MASGPLGRGLGKGSSALPGTPKPPRVLEAVQGAGTSPPHGLLRPRTPTAESGRRVALPHLHLHAQAVQEVPREGQAVHGRECGVDPACGRHAWLVLHGALTPGSRPLPGPTLMSQSGLSAPVHLGPPKRALAWPRAVSRLAPQEGRRRWLSRASSRYRGPCAAHPGPACAGRGADKAGVPRLGELGSPLCHPQRWSPGQTRGTTEWGTPGVGMASMRRDSEAQKSAETEAPDVTVRGCATSGETKYMLANRS